MMDKNLADTIARLRGIVPSAKPAVGNAGSGVSTGTPVASAPPKSNPENAAALESLLSQAPDMPNTDKQYTMEDLDNFLKAYINKD